MAIILMAGLLLCEKVVSMGTILLCYFNHTYKLIVYRPLNFLKNF